MAGHFKAGLSGDLVPLTAEEEAQYDVDQAASAAAVAARAPLDANAAAMRQSLVAHLQDALTLADALDANTATPAQQRTALSLCLRGTVRLSRLTLSIYDQAA
jgi:hypothetical protein